MSNINKTAALVVHDATKSDELSADLEAAWTRMMGLLIRAEFEVGGVDDEKHRSEIAKAAAEV